MGEIAEAYIWGEMNGSDMNDNPEAWIQYYKELEEDEFRKQENQRKRKANSKKYRQALLDKGGEQIPNTPIIKLGDWICYYKNGWAHDRHRQWVKISDFKVGDVEVECATYEKGKSIEVKLKPKKAKIEMNVEFE